MSETAVNQGGPVSNLPSFGYLDAAGTTDIGLKRLNNEDALLTLPECGVFCVADGMGGAQGGAVASQVVVSALEQSFTDPFNRQHAISSKAVARLTAQAVNSASLWIHNWAEQRYYNGTGTTVVALLFNALAPANAMVMHAGDSRAYRFRSNTLEQLTKDHSLFAAAGLSDEGDLPPLFRNIITKAVGLAPTVELDTTPVSINAGDLLLLCSDGLNKMITDHQIAVILQEHAQESLEIQAEYLIGAALDAGGDDNITVVLVRAGKDIPGTGSPTPSAETRTIEGLPAAGNRNFAPQLHKYNHCRSTNTPMTTAEESPPYQVKPDSAICNNCKLWNTFKWLSATLAVLLLIVITGLYHLFGRG